MRAIRQAEHAASRTCTRNRCAEVRISARRVRARVKFTGFFRHAERHRDTLGVDNSETFLTANVGGGLKWYRNDRWGLRGDYRFQAVRSKDSAPEFFGQNDRYGHRVYAAVVINAVR